MLCECKHCQKAFQSPTFSCTCNDCKQIDEEIYGRIKDFLETHPMSNALQISEALEIRNSLILKYIDERKLVIVKDGQKN